MAASAAPETWGSRPIPRCGHGRLPSTSHSEHLGNRMSAPAIDPAEPEYAARLGPLAALVANPQVSEVMVVAGRDVYVEVNGRLMLTPITFDSEQHGLAVIPFIFETAR